MPSVSVFPEPLAGQWAADGAGIDSTPRLNTARQNVHLCKMEGIYPLVTGNRSEAKSNMSLLQINKPNADHTVICFCRYLRLCKYETFLDKTQCIQFKDERVLTDFSNERGRGDVNYS